MKNMIPLNLNNIKTKNFTEKSKEQLVDKNIYNEAIQLNNSNPGGNSGTGGGNVSNFVSSVSDNGSNIVSHFMDAIMNNFSSFFHFSPVNGFLDDLIGQQIVLYFVILLGSISLVFLLTGFIINNLILLNKDYIVKQFSQRKIVQFYLKYQEVMIKLSLFFLPAFMYLALFTLIGSSYFMITHPIPYEQLGIDLHVLVDSSK